MQGILASRSMPSTPSVLSLPRCRGGEADIPALLRGDILALRLHWKGLTTRGALIGGLLGLISAVALVVLGPTVWEKVLLHPAGSAPFPYENPALFSMIIAFVGIWLFSVLDRSQTNATRLRPRNRSTSAPRLVWAQPAPRHIERPYL